MLIVKCDRCNSILTKGDIVFSTVTMLIGEEAIYANQDSIRIHLCRNCFGKQSDIVKEAYETKQGE